MTSKLARRLANIDAADRLLADAGAVLQAVQIALERDPAMDDDLVRHLMSGACQKVAAASALINPPEVATATPVPATTAI
jgi:hypothetical protein